MKDRELVEKHMMSQIVMHSKEQTVLSSGLVVNYHSDGSVKSLYTHNDCDFVKSFMKRLQSLVAAGVVTDAVSHKLDS